MPSTKAAETRSSIPLNEQFRFVHEPLDCISPSHLQRFVGREDELNELAGRIVLSQGGAFLITGYRGVGKSTFVNRVINEVETQLGQLSTTIGQTELVDVHLNVPRQMLSVELMYHVLRGLYRRLEAKRLLPLLDPALRRDLELAFYRTSQSIAIKNVSGIEGTIGVKINPLLPFAKSTSEVGLSSKRSESQAREISYLAYDDKAAEYDLINITRCLATGFSPRRSWWRSAWQAVVNRRPSPLVRLKLVFVFDELDKIEESSQGNESGIDAILANLKTLFTTSGSCFIFVAGRGTHDRWLEDVGLGDSIYESVFSYARYLQPMWAHADLMCDPFLGAGAFESLQATHLASTYASFKKFLAFNGRGIPRRILRKFNERVRLDGSRAVLDFSRDDVRQFRFFADLQDVLEANKDRVMGELQDDGFSGRADRQRLALYYLVDWILLRGFDEFTPADAAAASRRLSRLIAPREEAAPELAGRVLDLLYEQKYLEIPNPAQKDRSLDGADASSVPERYRLTRKRLIEMGSLAGVLEPEAQAVITSERAQRFGGRYEVQAVIARGGMSTVYMAEDRRVGRRVAIKEQLAEAADDPQVHQRFRHEVEILARLQHENVVRLYDADLDAKQSYIVMEYVEGSRLTDLIAQGAVSDEGPALTIARDLVRALCHVHQRGVLWLDPKPSNVLITPQGRLVLLDFGIARASGSANPETGTMLGTPAYSSPEQLRNETLDERSDIYSIGIIIYQMLTRRLPFSGDPLTLESALKRLTQLPSPPSEFATLSPQIEVVVLRCLEQERDKRYGSALELLAALPETPVDAPVDLSRLGSSAPQNQETPREPGTDVVPLGNTEPKTTVMLPSRSTVSGPHLLLPSGELRALDTTVVKIGRSTANDIQLSDATISRYHVELRQTREGWTLTDQNTRYGTKVNDTPVTAPRVLRDGDKIAIGNARIIFYSSTSVDAAAGPAKGQRLRHRDLADLLDKVRALAATGSLDELLTWVLDATIHLGHAERGFVMLKDEDGKLEFKAARARGGVSLPGKLFSTSRKIPEKVFASGQELFVQDLLDGGLAAIHEGTVALGIRHVFCFPIKTSTQSLGVIYLDTRERGVLPSGDVRTALGILASEAANALEQMSTRDVTRRSRALGRDLSIAAEVQRALRPVEDAQGSFYVMATRTSSRRTFGGELVDHFSTAPSSLGIMMLDVVGYGAPAASMQSHIQGLAKASSHQTEPSVLLKEINNAVVNRQMENRFATAFYGHLLQTGHFSYCNAGHVAPLHIAGGNVKRLETGGVVIGLFEHAEYEAGLEILTPGDTIVAFTAEVSEATNADGEEFGEERILQEVRMHIHEEPAAIADALLSTAHRFKTGERDDLTIMVLRYTGGATS